MAESSQSLLGWLLTSQSAGHFFFHVNFLHPLDVITLAQPTFSPCRLDKIDLAPVTFLTVRGKEKQARDKKRVVFWNPGFSILAVLVGLQR